MSSSQHFLVATVVDAVEWQRGSTGWLEAATTSLHRRAHERGLQITTDLTQLVEVLPGATRLRITLSGRADLA